jgi:hypothetical protein
MRKFARLFDVSKLGLVAAGIALGYLARLVLGGPEEESLPRAFDQPVVEPAEEVIDLPLINYSGSQTD